MRVLIDDIRDYQADIIIRNYDTAKIFLEAFLLNITYLMLDNDLGSRDHNDDGYKLACWIELQHSFLGDTALPDTVEVVTGNPAASAKMEQLFSKLYPYRKGRVFSKETL